MAAGIPEELQNVPASELPGKIAGFIESKMGVQVSVQDAYPLGRPDSTRLRRIFVRVATMAQADDIVRNRCKLKGNKCVFLDALNPSELAAQRRLRKSFDAARKFGLHAQFNRARLFVTETLEDGTKVKTEITGP